MLGNIGLLGVIFALVPGFIADLGYRACWGMEKGDDFERTLRALIWSILGLVLFVLLLGGPPNYISAVVPGEVPPAFDWRVGSAFGIHVLCCSVIAFATGAIASSDWAQQLFAQLFRRSLTSERPWDALWGRAAKGRGVRVVLKNGRVYAGALLRASTGEYEKELILGDPMTLIDGQFMPLQNSRILYVRQDELSEVHLNFTDEERADARRDNSQDDSAAVKRDKDGEHCSSLTEGATTDGATVPARDALRHGTASNRTNVDHTDVERNYTGSG